MVNPVQIQGGITFGRDAFHRVPELHDAWESRSRPGHAGGICAVNFADGSEVWNTPAVKPDGLDQPGCNAGQPAAATLIPGVVFFDSMHGHMRAYDPLTGEVIWVIDTKGGDITRRFRAHFSP